MAFCWRKYIYIFYDYKASKIFNRFYFICGMVKLSLIAKKIRFQASKAKVHDIQLERELGRPIYKAWIAG